MDSLGHQLDLKLRTWKPKTSQEVRKRVKEIIERADEESLDIGRSRAVEQEVLNALDEPRSR